MKDYNIEFGHIYANQEVSEEQLKSIDFLKKVTQKILEEKKSFSSVVLIDNLNTSEEKLSIKDYISFIQRKVQLDFLAFEASLSDLAEIFMQDLPPERIKKDEDKIYFKTEEATGKKFLLHINGKWCCSFLTAIWYLCRLGVYELPKNVQTFSENEFAAKAIINILPQEYQKSEEAALELIKSTKYQTRIKDISYVYFQSKISRERKQEKDGLTDYTPHLGRGNI